jgi:polysaccharide biosynthesis/export protein
MCIHLREGQLGGESFALGELHFSARAKELAASGRQKRIGNPMKYLPCTLLVVLSLSTGSSGLAQQPNARPVLSLEPPSELAPATPAQVVPAPTQVDANYIIGADDSIKIEVHERPEFSGTLPVRPDGKITLPLIGDVPAAGLSPMQLAADLTVRLSSQVIDPVVNVTVMAVNSKRIFLVGEVGHVGPLSLTPGMTILQAIASAGGVTPYANRNHIYILRGDPTKPQKISFNYTKAVKKGDMQGITLVPGDTIVVP